LPCAVDFEETERRLGAKKDPPGSREHTLGDARYDEGNSPVLGGNSETVRSYGQGPCSMTDTDK